MALKYLSVKIMLSKVLTVLYTNFYLIYSTSVWTKMNQPVYGKLANAYGMMTNGADVGDVFQYIIELCEPSEYCNQFKIQ